MLSKRYVTTSLLDAVIDLERLRSGPADALERDAKTFFGLTFPSDDVHALMRVLSKRFSGEKAEGVVLAQAVKGLGKSHTLLLVHHLFNSPTEATEWAGKIGHPWSPPGNTVTLVHKFTDRSLPADALWLLVGERLGANWSDNNPPSLEQLLGAIGTRHLVLVFDELERGIQGIVNEARRTQNLNFLQMLSEAANRDAPVTLVAAVYDGTAEPGATLRRVPHVELRFRKTEDRAAIVRHRLFRDADRYDREAARALIQSYINTWKRFGVETPASYVSRMEATFPFLPDLVELVFTRITQTGAFQGTRSALGLLGAMLDASDNGAYLMSAANCRVSDAACADRLQDLNPSGNLINCAASNYHDLAAQPFAEAIASATLLASLVPGSPVGLSKDELVRHVVRPGDDPNDFLAALDAFRKYGTYFHEADGRYRFDLHENEHAKVQLNASKYSDELAQEQLVSTWLHDVFQDTTETVVFLDLDQTKNGLEALSLRERRFVLAPRRLSAEERHALYVGAQKRNQIILIEPRDRNANLLQDANLLAYARRIKAAGELANSGGNADSRRKYEDIRSDEGRALQRLLRNAGSIYVRVERWAETVAETQFEDEPLGQAASKREVVDQLLAGIFPPALFAEHLGDRLDQFYGQRVEQVDRAYRNNLGFPVPLHADTITRAIHELVQDPRRVLGLRHQRLGGGACGELVHLMEAEFAQAELAPPWPKALPPAGDVGSPKPAEPAPISSPGDSPTPVAGHRVEDRTTPHCAGLGELRQQVAAKLVDLDAPIIRQARFSIFTDFKNADLASLPAAYRGGLAGSGDLDLQLEITLHGPLTKAQLEQRCEQLPSLNTASYAARITLEVDVAAPEAD